jgi:hypothetical protein
MPSTHDFNPTPHELHPEFGYLCPSRQVRKTVRVAFAAAVFGITVGAAGAFVLTPRHDPDLERPQTASTAGQSTFGQENASARGHADAPAAETTGAASRAPSAPRTTVAADAGTPDQPAPPSTRATTGKAEPSTAPGGRRCQDQAWPLLDSKCMSGAGRKSRHVRVIPLNDPAQAAPAAPAAPGAPAAPSATATAVPPSETSVAVATPPEPVVTRKKREKAAQNRQRRRNRDLEDYDPRGAYGTAYDPRAEPPRRSAWSWSW